MAISFSEKEVGRLVLFPISIASSANAASTKHNAFDTNHVKAVKASPACESFFGVPVILGHQFCDDWF